MAAVIMIASLFTALTMTPMLSSRLLTESYGRGRRSGLFFRVTETGFERLATAYSTLLGWCLRHRKTVLLGIFVLFLVTLSLLPVIGWEFIPKEDRGFIIGTVELPIGTRVERTADTIQAVYRTILEEVPAEQIQAVYTWCGVSESGFSADEGTYRGEFGLKLVPK